MEKRSSTKCIFVFTKPHQRTVLRNHTPVHTIYIYLSVTSYLQLDFPPGHLHSDLKIKISDGCIISSHVLHFPSSPSSHHHHRHQRWFIQSNDMWWRIQVTDIFNIVFFKMTLRRLFKSKYSLHYFENCTLLGSYAASSGNFLPTFWDNTGWDR